MLSWTKIGMESCLKYYEAYNILCFSYQPEASAKVMWVVIWCLGIFCGVKRSKPHLVTLHSLAQWKYQPYRVNELLWKPSYKWNYFTLSISGSLGQPTVGLMHMKKDMSSWFFLWNICDLRNPPWFLPGRTYLLMPVFFLCAQQLAVFPLGVVTSHHTLRLFTLCGWVGWSHGGLHCRVEGPLGVTWPQLHWLEQWCFGTGEPNSFVRG